MRALEQQQAQELLSIPYDPNAPNGNSLQHMAASAPTTPPRVNTVLNEEHVGSGVRFSAYQSPMDPDVLSRAVGSAVSDKKSVTYAPPIDHSPDLLHGTGSNGFSRAAGAKSMPTSRRTSASEHDEDLASHLQNLALVGERSNRASPAPSMVPPLLISKGNRRHADDDSTHYGNVYNAGMMLDEQLDKEMHSPWFSPLLCNTSL